MAGRAGAAAADALVADALELLLDDELVHRAAALAAVFLGPADRGPAAGHDLLEERVAFRAGAAGVVLQLGAQRVGHVLGDEGLHVAAELFLCGVNSNSMLAS